MKKGILFSLIAIIILVLCSCSGEKTTLIFGEAKRNNSLTEIMQFDDGSKLLSEYESIKYRKNGDEIISLSDAIDQNLITIDEIISQMEYYTEANDGGSKVYKYDPKSNDLAEASFVLIKCNKLDGNRDILIGTNDNVINNH